MLKPFINYMSKAHEKNRPLKTTFPHKTPQFIPYYHLFTTKQRLFI